MKSMIFNSTIILFIILSLGCASTPVVVKTEEVVVKSQDRFPSKIDLERYEVIFVNNEDEELPNFTLDVIEKIDERAFYIIKIDDYKKAGRNIQKLKFSIKEMKEIIKYYQETQK